MYRKEDSYWQILFANMSPSLCPLLALGIYVSLFADGDLCKHENRIVKKSEKHKEPKLPGFFRLGRDKCYGKASLNYRFRMCVEKLGFEGRLSPHSIRKLSATEMQMNGCSREVSDQRGRWVQRHAHKASAVYYKEFLRKADFEAASALAGPLGIAQYKGAVTDEIA